MLAYLASKRHHLSLDINKGTIQFKMERIVSPYSVTLIYNLELVTRSGTRHVTCCCSWFTIWTWEGIRGAWLFCRCGRELSPPRNFCNSGTCIKPSSTITISGQRTVKSLCRKACRRREPVEPVLLSPINATMYVRFEEVVSKQLQVIQSRRVEYGGHVWQCHKVVRSYQRGIAR